MSDNENGPRGRKPSKYPKKIIICIVSSFITTGLLCSAAGMFSMTRRHDYTWLEYLERDPLFDCVRKSIGYPDPHPDPKRARGWRWPKPRAKAKTTILSDIVPLPDGSLCGNTTAARTSQQDLHDTVRSNLERTSKSDEKVFSAFGILLATTSSLAFILPLLYRLRYVFRSRLLKLGFVYLAMFLICVVVGSVEIESVFETDDAYVDYENIANDLHDDGAILLSSCHISSYNEFDSIVKRKPKFVHIRKKMHVCQDWEMKLISAVIVLISGGVQLFIGTTLICHYKYIIENNILPPEESHALSVIENRNDIVAQFEAKQRATRKKPALDSANKGNQTALSEQNSGQFSNTS